MTDDNDDGKAEATFTRAQFAKELNKQVREKVAAALAEYGDLDDLKRKAAAADANESKIDQMLSKLTAAEERASKAESETLRRSVADELGLTPAQARRLTGKTRDELLADGEAYIEENGIKPRKGVAPKRQKDADEDDKGAGDDTGRDEQGDDNEDDDEDAGREQASRRQDSDGSRRSGRPTENLRPGAVRTPRKPEETDPAKLAALIPRR